MLSQILDLKIIEPEPDWRAALCQMTNTVPGEQSMLEADSLKTLALSRNPFWVRMEARRLEMLAWIMENDSDPSVQEIYRWDGERVTDYCDDEGYCGLCKVLWDRVVDYSGCSSTNQDCYKFVSDMILVVISQNLYDKKKCLKEKIERHQKELAELEKELNSIPATR